MVFTALPQQRGQGAQQEPAVAQGPAVEQGVGFEAEEEAFAHDFVGTSAASSAWTTV